MKKIKVIIGIVFAALIMVMLTKVLFFQSKQIENVKAVQNMDIDQNALVEHLSQSLKFRTISYDDNADSSKEELLALHSYLEESYPLVHKELKKEIINEYTLFYTHMARNKS